MTIVTDTSITKETAAYFDLLNVAKDTIAELIHDDHHAS